jgi:hypothetical protein
MEQLTERYGANAVSTREEMRIRADEPSFDRAADASGQTVSPPRVEGDLS